MSKSNRSFSKVGRFLLEGPVMSCPSLAATFLTCMSYKKWVPAAILTVLMLKKMYESSFQSEVLFFCVRFFSLRHFSSARWTIFRRYPHPGKLEGWAVCGYGCRNLMKLPKAQKTSQKGRSQSWVAEFYAVRILPKNCWEVSASSSALFWALKEPGIFW